MSIRRYDTETPSIRKEFATNIRSQPRFQAAVLAGVQFNEKKKLNRKMHEYTKTYFLIDINCFLKSICQAINF